MALFRPGRGPGKPGQQRRSPLPRGPLTTPPFLQAATQYQSGTATNVLAFRTAITYGSLLILGSENDASVVISGVADSQGNAWSRATSILHNFSTKDCELWYA